MNVIPLPLFDFAEAQRIARAVGFNPTHAGLARDFMRDVAHNGVALPAGLPKRQQLRALFYVALGAFIYELYVEPGDPLPGHVADWYELNTALTMGGSDATRLFGGCPDEP